MSSVDQGDRRSSVPDTRPPVQRSWLIRAVPGLLLGIALVAVLVALLIGANSGLTHHESTEFSFGPFDVVVVYAIPTVAMVVAGLLVTIGSVLFVHGLDAWAARRVTRPDRRPREASERPLRSEATRNRPSGTISVTALIPARNEEEDLPFTIASLRRQTRPPEAIWVIADNCTDRTADVARDLGANVFTTVDNHNRKAGGLNQLLRQLLPTLGPLDVILVMDADTVMVDDFLERGIAEFDAAPDLDAVGGVFYGNEAPGLLAQMQRNEYLRYSRDISRRHGKVFVLTGTASLFRADALVAVARSRGSSLPGVEGNVYDVYSLTEDNELTLALKTLGASMISPQFCRVRTELMPTWGDLWRQRQRWQRGALENIGMYGLTSASARYWVQQFALGYGVLALMSYLALSALAVFTFGVFVLVVFWVIVGGLFLVERTVTVWSGGWRARLLAMPLVVELVYAAFLQVVYLKSLIDIVLGRSKRWNAAIVHPVAAT
jgi:cellulose synthase/poly-beta-1,6-N-acetylglucosamine synthase-like glycosyltransferase